MATATMKTDSHSARSFLTLNDGRAPGAETSASKLQHDLEFVLASPNGMLISANHVGHAVHESDPSLVAGLIKQVFNH
jgi:hypothetical protein